MSHQIEIRPTSGVFATYRRLSYKPWYAVAEFVDNATQSFFDHEDALTAAAETLTPLEVRIFHDKNAATLTVADTAFGMNFADFQRAIQLNRPPTGPKTRNEFGMGLKTAACWMGNRWTVTSKALGSDTEFSATVDVDALATAEPDAIPVTIRTGLDPQDHYTVVHIEEMYRVFQTKTTGRIKELLGSMYRRDIASLRIGIFWNDEALGWQPDPVYTERLPDGSHLPWRTDVDAEVNGLPVRGSVQIRLPGNARRAGLHLFRKGRIVLGGPGAGWKPYDLYGAPNSFASQRLVGELDLDDWPVTQAKDGFDWDGGLEENLISVLEPLLRPLIDKASGRLKEDGTEESGEEPSAADAALAVDTIAPDIAAPEVGATVSFLEEEAPVPEPTSAEQETLVSLAESTGTAPTLTAIGPSGEPTVKWWLLDKEHPLEPFVKLAFPTEDVLHVFVNLRHPFAEEHVGGDQLKLVLYLKLLLADALVERAVVRRPGQDFSPATMRRFKDQFLRSLPGLTGAGV